VPNDLPTHDGSSRIGLGLAAVARPAYITSGRGEDLGAERGVDRLRRRCHALLDAAYSGGVRYVDVARSYGLAEQFLAGWLAARPEAAEVVVGSKWGYRYVGHWQLDASVHEIKDHSPEAFAEQRALTRQLLGRRLAIYHVHSATLESPALTDARLYHDLAGLRAEGVRIGISASGPQQAEAVRRALEVSVDGAPLFTSIEATWNLLEPSAGPALAEAARAGATVIVKEVVANGRLAPGADDPAPAAVLARGVAARLGVGVDQVAIAAALVQPWAWRVLSGAVTTGQVAENLAGETLRLAPDVVAELTSQPQPASDYWAARSARSWT
jgi:aryl-alcohol dehydrogenase-like predicted oxidoreductase